MTEDEAKAVALAQAQKNKLAPSSTVSAVSVIALVGFGIAGLILWPHIKKVIG